MNNLLSWEWPIQKAKRAVALAIFCFMLPIAQAKADTPVYVELYTSQGCSSCPAADAVLSKLADRRDVIAVAFHVDYWDYIGWKDSFGSAKNTQRQKKIARYNNVRRIYTPQMIVHGMQDVVGSRPMEVSAAIAKAANITPILDIMVDRQGDRARLMARPLRKMPNMQIHVNLLHVTPQQSVAITRGENAGRSFEYRNIVRKLELIESWSGRNNFDQTIHLPQGVDLYAIFQEYGVGAVLGAVRLQ